jgi:hypothetical protein
MQLRIPTCSRPRRASATLARVVATMFLAFGSYGVLLYDPTPAPGAGTPPAADGAEGAATASAA